MAEENDDDDADKTEDPTERRLEEATKSGKVIYSREVTNFLIILALAITIALLGPWFSRTATLNLSNYITNPHDISVDEHSLKTIFGKLAFDSFGIMIIPLLLTLIFASGSSYLQNGKFVFSWDSLSPKLEKISIIKGLERLFSSKSLIELIKSLIKLTIIGIVGYFAILSDLPKLKLLHEYSISGILAFIWSLSVDILIAILIVLAIIAAMDYLYQRHLFFQKLKMSKYDIKKESKESEGNPEIKAKIRSLRMERAKKRMMQDVPKADVVITNPTHFAVALKYDQERMSAPMVVAKGQDFMALAMRKIAVENKIPIIENPPLARILYASVSIDQEIPVEHYQAVAEIIKYVYKLKELG